MNTVMRISLVLAREDNPRLYDELAQFPKGQRRVNRLRTLAYDGLLALRAPAALQPMIGGSDMRQADSPLPSERAQASLEMFSEPISE
jgi:hypothetical protein